MFTGRKASSNHLQKMLMLNLPCQNALKLIYSNVIMTSNIFHCLVLKLGPLLSTPPCKSPRSASFRLSTLTEKQRELWPSVLTLKMVAIGVVYVENKCGSCAQHSTEHHHLMVTVSHEVLPAANVIEMMEDTLDIGWKR